MNTFPHFSTNVIYSSQNKCSINLDTFRVIDYTSDYCVVLDLVDGEKDIDTIFNLLSEEYGVTRDKLCEFLNVLNSMGIVEFSDTPINNSYNQLRPSNINIVTIAITDKCNLKCRYCYGSFGPQNKNVFTVEEIIPLFDKLLELGTDIVELTGGEPTCNPEFNEILSAACERFKAVHILTNAVHIKQSTFDLFTKYAEKLSISVSIDGNSESTNFYARQVKNTFNKSIKNIELLYNVVKPKDFKITYMLTTENVCDFESFIIEMLNKGIPDISVSIPEYVDEGRHYHLPDGCNMSDRTSTSRIELETVAKKIYDKYSDNILSPLDKMPYDKYILASILPSCGAGWKTMAIMANGDVIPCNMMNSKYLIGNCKTDPTFNFFNEKNDIVQVFSRINLSFENENRKCCNHCESMPRCGKCLFRILSVNKERVQKGLDICLLLKKYSFTTDIITR